METMNTVTAALNQIPTPIPAAGMRILTWFDKRLLVKCKPITGQQVKDEWFQSQLLAMEKLLADTPTGVGLAATQVGLGFRAFAISRPIKVLEIKPGCPDCKGAGLVDGRSDSERIMNLPGLQKSCGRCMVNKIETSSILNPVIAEYIGTPTAIGEACLSLPGVGGKVVRWPSVRFFWIDRLGEPHIDVAEGLFAQVVQHEINHLDGKLYVDMLSRTARGHVLKEYWRKTSEPKLQELTGVGGMMV